jgi:hypothetical protein
MKIFEPATLFYAIHEVPGQLATVLQHAGKAQKTEFQNT